MCGKSGLQHELAYTLLHENDSSPHMKPTLEISDVAIDGYAQKITLRSFRPLTRNSLPIVLYFHGGCFVKGTLDDADIPASFIASKTPAWVVAVGYSLAPAFPFPAAMRMRISRWSGRHCVRERAVPMC